MDVGLAPKPVLTPKNKEELKMIMGVSFTIVPSYVSAEQPAEIQEKSINKRFFNETRGIQKYEELLTEALNIYGRNLNTHNGK